VLEDSSGAPFLLRFFLFFRPISRREADLEPPVLGARHRLLSSNDPLARKVTIFFRPRISRRVWWWWW
jgi:hypothetical protein